MREEITERNLNNKGFACRSERPNVIVIVPHDLGDYLGCYGHTVSTPNIDRMAQEGILFANHFCTSPWCSPARGSIITGKYPHTNGLMGLVNLGWDMPQYNITDAQRFADSGYCTYLAGFQHEKQSRSNLGFQYDMENVTENHNADVVAGVVEQLLQELAMSKKSATETCKQPFYIRIGVNEVHRSWWESKSKYYGYDWTYDHGIVESEVEVLPQWKDNPGLRRDLTGFTGDVNRLDCAVGNIMHALQKYGFDNNTLVVFTTDHGIDFPCGKGTLYDLGIRTALIMWYPERFKGGAVVNALTSHIDILPTLLELCDMRQTSGIQGTSLIPLIEGKSSMVHNEIFAEESTYPKNIMRCIRTENFKFIRNFSMGEKSNAVANGLNSRAVADTERFYFVNRPETELYDITNDPHELNNLAGNAIYQIVESELNERLERWMQETCDPVLNGAINRPKDELEIITKLPEIVQTEHLQLSWK